MSRPWAENWGLNHEGDLNPAKEKEPTPCPLLGGITEPPWHKQCRFCCEGLALGRRLSPRAPDLTSSGPEAGRVPLSARVVGCPVTAAPGQLKRWGVGRYK